MFASNDVKLFVGIGADELILNLYLQPFAIKSRISDISHDTYELQGISVKKRLFHQGV